jgi:hypothetical protein
LSKLCVEVFEGRIGFPAKLQHQKCSCNRLGHTRAAAVAYAVTAGPCGGKEENPAIVLESEPKERQSDQPLAHAAIPKANA